MSEYGGGGRPAGTSEQVRVNHAVWSGHRFFAAYARRDVRAAEAVVLLRYRADFEGRVLEIGAGAGRLTGFLAELGDVLGIDISAPMVEYSRRAYPEASFEVGDMRDLSAHGPQAFSAIVAADAVIDVLDDEERRRVLAGFRTALRPNGLLAFSSHNRDYAPRAGTRVAHVAARLQKLPVLARDPGRLPARSRNRRRLAPLQREEREYAVRNDGSHDFSLLHYYVSRDAQERQLAECGFGLIECLDDQGRTVEATQRAPECLELYYVARPSDQSSATTTAEA